MGAALRKALQALEEARNEVLVVQPLTLPEEYLRRIESVEARTDNQSGADKTWVSVARRRFDNALIGAVRVR